MNRIPRLTGKTTVVRAVVGLGLGIAALGPGGMVHGAEKAAVRLERPRLTDPADVANQREAIARGGPEARAARQACEGRLRSRTGKYAAPGYARFDWGASAQHLARCGLIFRQADPEASTRYWNEALVYMKALAWDLETVGDGKGGLRALQQDSGFPIRSHGVSLPLAYDMAYEAPGFSQDLKRRLADEMVKWVDWYEGKLDGKGGLDVKGTAWRNYFSGYFLARGLIGLAIFGDHPRGAELVDTTRQLWREKVKPDLDDRLGGGYPPEGWGYGSGVVQRYLEYARSARAATGEDVMREVRFFRDAIRAIVHGTKPDRRGCYDGGDWAGDQVGVSPTWLLANLKDTYRDQPEGQLAQAYLALSQKPTAEALAAMSSQPLSYLARGTNLAMMRSSWGPDAVWAAFQSGGPHFADHQNRDQGHFTVWYRGKDLLIDAGMWRESRPGLNINNFANETSWHNSILIDDKKEGRLTYPPGQGYWGKRLTRAFEDGGRYVLVSADITGAYAPPDDRVQYHGAKSAVEKVTRDLIFIRPDHFVVVDRVRTAKDYYGKRVVFHFANAAEPAVMQEYVESRQGDAKILIQSLLPGNAVVEKQRTLSPRCNNDPKCPNFTWRIEVSPAGLGQDDVFLHVLAAVDAAASPAASLGTRVPVSAGRAVGALLQMAGGPVVVLVNPDAQGVGGPLRYAVPSLARVQHLVFGMAPGARYRADVVQAGDGLGITVASDPAGPLTATPGGVVAFVVGK